MQTYRTHTPHARGFSLLELSIVLVILALIAGGVLVGRDMIRTAKLKSIPKEKNELVIAIKSFKDAYNYLPGDYPNATRTWDVQDADPATCVETPSFLFNEDNVGGPPKTCDGNGDGSVGRLFVNKLYTDNTLNYEMFRFWQHLSYAGMLEGEFTGVSYVYDADATTEAAIIAYAAAHSSPTLVPVETAASFGHNAPASDWGKKSGWNVIKTGSLANTCGTTFIEGHALVFASHVGGETFNIGLTQESIELPTPFEASKIDDKLDDGEPFTGRMQASLQNCFDNCNDGTSYKISDLGGSCVLMFMDEF